VRAADVGDAPAIANVHLIGWRTTYNGIVPDSYLERLDTLHSASWWRGYLADPAICTVVGDDDTDGVVGFASAEGGELYALYVLPGHQLKGLGRRLLGEIAHRLGERGARELCVWALERNPCIEFYRRVGGREIGRKSIVLDGVELEELAFAFTLPLREWDHEWSGPA
jgi:GNAT superfamily N-acetyltransferase